MPMRGVYIQHFDQISVKISVLGSYTLTVAPMGVKFGTQEKCQISPLSVQCVALRGEKPQIRPVSNLNNRHFALRAMLPVNYCSHKTFGDAKRVALSNYS